MHLKKVKSTVGKEHNREVVMYAWRSIIFSYDVDSVDVRCQNLKYYQKFKYMHSTNCAMQCQQCYIKVCRQRKTDDHRISVTHTFSIKGMTEVKGHSSGVFRTFVAHHKHRKCTKCVVQCRTTEFHKGHSPLCQIHRVRLKLGQEISTIV